MTSVAERLRAQFDALTRAERQLAGAMLANYPVSAMGGIAQLAEAAGVSPPTVARMARKIGFGGFPEMQSAIRDEIGAEIEAGMSTPLSRFTLGQGIKLANATAGGANVEGAEGAEGDEGAKTNASSDHILSRSAELVVSNLRQSLAQLDPASFDQALGLLADDGHAVHVMGGRISNALASYFFTHLQVLRSDMSILPANSNSWPHYVLNMQEGDLLVAFDIRRYERDIEKLAGMAAARGVKIILLTDQWGSPASTYADIVFNLAIEGVSGWDSSVMLLVLVEALIAGLQERAPERARTRMAELEMLFDDTGLFKKFT